MNLVMGVCVDNRPEGMCDIFFKSLRANEYWGDAIILYDRVPDSRQQLFKDLRVTCLEGYEKPSPFFLGQWALYIPILEKGDWEKVFIADLRDVAFQDNIDKYIADGLHVTEESANINQENLNPQWLKEHGGQEALDKYGDLPILCSGTMWGDRQSMLDWCKYVGSHGAKGSVDQGTLNYGVRSGEVPAVIHENGEIVWTLGLENFDFAANVLNEANYTVANNKIVMSNGHTPPVLHQYFRHKKMNAIVGEIYL